MFRPIAARWGAGAVAALALTATVGLGAPSASAAASDCPAPTGSPAYPASSATLGTSQSSVPRGGSTAVSGTGFQASSTVAIYLCSTPILLGNAAADGNGAFNVTATIPTSADLGQHVIQARGNDSTGQPLILNTDLTVTAASTGGTGGTGTTTGSLPRTGRDIAEVVAIALLALTGGTLLLETNRRRLA